MELPEQAFGLKGRLRGQGPPEGLVPVGREGAARILAWPGEVFVEDRIEQMPVKMPSDNCTLQMTGPAIATAPDGAVWCSLLALR